MARSGRKFPLTRRSCSQRHNRDSTIKEEHLTDAGNGKDVVNGLQTEASDPQSHGDELEDGVDGTVCNKHDKVHKPGRNGKTPSKGVAIALPQYDTIDMAVSRPEHDSSFTTSESDTHSLPASVPPGKGGDGLPPDAMLDSPDYNPESLTFSCFDCVIYLLSIGTYLADIGSDIWLAAVYYQRERWWWCGLTLSFVLIPSLVMGAFSLRWYLIDHRNETNISWPRWICRIIFVTFQGALILRYIEVIVFGMRTKKTDEKRKKREWFKQMIYEDVDSALLRLFETFMEAAPQLVLQLYIMLRSHGQTDTMTVTVQWVSAGASLGSLSWALAAYHRSLRFSLENKANISYVGVGVQFLWRTFTIGARVVSFAIFASYSPEGVFIVIGVHWIIMVIWIRLQESNFCHHKCEEFLFNLVAACVHIFCYFNLVEGHTRLKYIFYYTLVYLENVGMLVAWYLMTQTEDLWYRYPACGVVLGGFFVGIMFQIIYYLKLHPNNFSDDKQHPSIKLWVPFSQLSCTAFRKKRKRKKKSSKSKDSPRNTKVSTEVQMSGDSHVTTVVDRELDDSPKYLEGKMPVVTVSATENEV